MSHQHPDPFGWWQLWGHCVHPKPQYHVWGTQLWSQAQENPQHHSSHWVSLDLSTCRPTAPPLQLERPVVWSRNLSWETFPSCLQSEQLRPTQPSAPVPTEGDSITDHKCVSEALLLPPKCRSHGCRAAGAHQLQWEGPAP